MLPRFYPLSFGLLLLSLTGCSHKSEPPRYYDQGLRVPKPYDPRKVTQAPSHTLPAQDPGIDVWAARFSIEPRLEHAPLSSVFESPQDILVATDLEATSSKLKQISSATAQYHQELLDLVGSAGEIDAAHLALIVDVAYYPEALRAHMEKVASGLVRKVDALSQLQLQAILKNLQRARGLGALTNKILAVGIPKATDLDADTAQALLSKLIVQAEEAEETTEALAAYSARFVDLEPAQLLALSEIAKLKKSYLFASDVAYQWFAHGHTAHELVALMAGFPPGDALDSLIARGASDLLEATAEDVGALTRALHGELAITGTVPTLIATLPSLSASQLRRIAGAIVAGHPRDSVITGAIERLTEVTLPEAESLLELFYVPASRDKAAQLLSKKRRN